MDTAWHKNSLSRACGERWLKAGRGGKEPAKPLLGGFSPHDGATKKEKRRDVACNVSRTKSQYLCRLAGVGWALAHRGVACFLHARQARPSSRVTTQFSCFETLQATSLQNPAITPPGNGDNPQRLRTCHSTRRMPRAAVRVRPATIPTHNPATPMLSQ